MFPIPAVIDKKNHFFTTLIMKGGQEGECVIYVHAFLESIIAHNNQVISDIFAVNGVNVKNSVKTIG